MAFKGQVLPEWNVDFELKEGKKISLTQENCTLVTSEIIKKVLGEN